MTLSCDSLFIDDPMVVEMTAQYAFCSYEIAADIQKQFFK